MLNTTKKQQPLTVQSIPSTEAQIAPTLNPSSGSKKLVIHIRKLDRLETTATSPNELAFG